MKKNWLALPVLACFCFISVFSPVLTAYEGQALLEHAKQERASRADYASRQGAELRLTGDGKSFILEWFPEAFQANESPYVIVTVGGHSTFAFDDFSVWHPFLKDRKFGFLALQWWFGENQHRYGYLTPEQMYSIISSELKRLNIRPGHALLHGFSRGAANTYALAALDRKSGQNYFGLIVANSGGMARNYPPNQEIDSGAYGNQPLTGTRWITFAGGKDTRPQQSGIPSMRETGEWLKAHGGTLVLALEDPDGGHGGFHMNPQNANRALDIFEALGKGA